MNHAEFQRVREQMAEKLSAEHAKRPTRSNVVLLAAAVIGSCLVWTGLTGMTTAPLVAQPDPLLPARMGSAFLCLLVQLACLRVVHREFGSSGRWLS